MNANTYTSPFAGLDTALIGKPSRQPPQRQEEQEDRQQRQVKQAPATQGKRSLKQQSMVFYEDQLFTLNRYSSLLAVEGVKKSASEMIREALDEYIEKNQIKKKLPAPK